MCKLAILSSNAKLEKSIAEHGENILTAGLFMAPHLRSGTNLCPMAGFCSAVCNLWFSGRTVTSTVRAAMLRRAKLYIEDRETFNRLVDGDITRLLKKGDRLGKDLYIRPNGATDQNFSEIAERHQSAEFYDYTKRLDIMSRYLAGDWPKNYSLCYSWSERADSGVARAHLELGGTVAVVFDTAYHPQSGTIGELPKSFEIGGKLFPVRDGDKHDLRHLRFDDAGTIQGLRFKGSRKLLQQSIERGFTQRGS